MTIQGSGQMNKKEICMKCSTMVEELNGRGVCYPCNDWGSV